MSIENAKHKNKKLYTLISYISIYMLLYMPNAYGITKRFSGTVQMLVIMFFAGILLCLSVICGRLNKVSGKSLMYLFVSVFFILCGCFLRSEDIKQTAIVIIMLVLAYIYSVCLSAHDFAEKFINIIYFLCVYSLITFFLYKLNPSIVERFPIVYNEMDYLAYNMGFSMIRSYSERNQGIFWEPGAFQTFIGIALILELFLIKRFSKKRIIVYLATVFTTYSTTGYVSVVVILLVYMIYVMINKVERNFKNVRSLLFLIGLVAVLYLIFTNLSTETSKHVFGKITAYRNDTSRVKKMTSASVRVDAILKPISLFLDNPVFGVGTTGLNGFASEEGYKMNTCTFVNWFAMYGFIVGMIFVGGFYKISKYITGNRTTALLVLIAFFILTISEDYVRNPSILVFVFWGYNCFKNNETEELIDEKQLEENTGIG